MNKLIAYLPNPTTPIYGSPITLGEIQDRIEQIARFLIVVSIVIAVGMIVWGGIKLMVARGDAKATGEAWGIIRGGIIGAAVVLAVGVILQTVAGLVTRSFFG